MQNKTVISKLSDLLFALAFAAIGAGILLCTPTLTLNPLTWLGAASCIFVGLFFVVLGLEIIKEVFNDPHL